MTNEDQRLDENELDSTLEEERNSEDASELEDLFTDDEPEGESDEDKVKRLEEQISRIEKGVKKLATDKGREKVEVKETEPTQSVNDEVVEELLLTKHPEAEHILDELKDVAKQTSKSILKLYRESKYFQGEAKSIEDAKKVEEEAKSKITKPSNGSPARKDFSNVKSEEDLKKLSHEDKVAFFNMQLEKERQG